jgi:hypothetical protein
MPMFSNTGLAIRTQVFVVLAGVAILLFVLYLVRNKHLREQYALLWILAALVLIFSAVFIEWLEKLSHAVGIDYPPAFLFLVAIVMMLVLQIHFSTVISNLREQNRVLIQDLGILTVQMQDLRNQIERGCGGTRGQPKQGTHRRRGPKKVEG